MRKTYRRQVLSDEVREAFSTRKGVVALESTVITHGLPYPENLQTALELEETVRENGAVPATIAVIDGLIRVGLNRDELERLAKDQGAKKLSRRDLPLALALKQTGGTTVATTMIIAHHAGIRIFATGGVGGVHRGGEETFDISADLEELGRTSVCVVSAGAKAVLDLPKTLEVLETKGVPVIGYGCDEFPAFYYRNSGLSNTVRLDEVDQISEVLLHKWNLTRWPDSMEFAGGVLVANPIPAEDEIPRAEIEAFITQALDEMTVTGKDVTPYLLKRVGELSEGKSKLSNMALIKNNAALSAKIAADLAEKL
ncbi:pseudouridine-5'-phosphate glycosidase [Terasakiella sp. A23]|uniref:pseudouridine-5'-phosphate glycosidase n=1 Tax=Terasakiella sp. FCG-A23 TaxID=3080561 RepID=UPI002954F5AF|nr:pseudouridine-5'-phosphate glycosidase [Terasakiella sp. A23]MDV7341314.1 pseudouridine-5'-phosphate glycosidase [Terasakiella sp. A23]